MHDNLVVLHSYAIVDEHRSQVSCRCLIAACAAAGLQRQSGVGLPRPLLRVHFQGLGCSCAQVQKIRLLLRERGLGAVRVGTVDDYQGQEERIILISTARPAPGSGFMVFAPCWPEHVKTAHMSQTSVHIG